MENLVSYYWHKPFGINYVVKLMCFDKSVSIFVVLEVNLGIV
jgi:hypothetical protein